MTDREYIDAVKRGERIKPRYSLHDAELPTSATCHHVWRTIACVSEEEDVIECSRCGKQQVCRCDFNEEFA